MYYIDLAERPHADRHEKDRQTRRAALMHSRRTTLAQTGPGPVTLQNELEKHVGHCTLVRQS